ncbi:unnamed protein product [Fraxinus pennsylvanica]|uniref:CCHC-type domain-containing protein n=1 Tax=Fraxinus pennsylvanica TaxID=56036 RepID=A0AAD2DJK8_9LAMI|nr:unnamed protein product [Fraxinus pennsylvanica]
MALEDIYAKISLEDEEQGVELQGDDAIQENEEYRYCLVGRFLTDRIIHFVSMRNTMAAIWRPKKGICIKDIGAGLYIFQFFHALDMDRVLQDGPWTFNQHLLILKHLKDDANPMRVDLFETSFWVQVNEVPAGFRSERILIHIGNYIGAFLSSDSNNFSGGWKAFLRIRVLMDVRLPLKRRMKLRKPGGEWIWVTFKYEKLPTFCFICGIIGHADSSCEKFYEAQGGEIERPYGLFLKAPSRNVPASVGEKWLRSSPAEDSGSKYGKDVTDAVDEEVSLQEGENLSLAIKGKGVIRESASINPIPEKMPPSMPQLKENPLFNNAQAGYLQGMDNAVNLGLVIMDQKRRRTDPHTEVNLNNPAYEPDLMQEDPKNEVAVGSAQQAHRST